MMDVRPLRTEADYAWALTQIESYFENPPAPGSPEADRFDVLSTLLKSYEEQHDPFPEADPVDILHFAIQNMGRSQSDLARILGSRPRASEILNRRRGLTIEMIHAISQEWHLPVALLAKPYPLRPPAPSAA